MVNLEWSGGLLEKIENNQVRDTPVEQGKTFASGKCLF